MRTPHPDRHPDSLTAEERAADGLDRFEPYRRPAEDSNGYIGRCCTALVTTARMEVENAAERSLCAASLLDAERRSAAEDDEPSRRMWLARAIGERARLDRLEAEHRRILLYRSRVLAVLRAEIEAVAALDAHGALIDALGA